MPSPTEIPPPADPVLASLLAARPSGEAAAREILGRVLHTEAAPLLAATIRARLSDVPHADQEEVLAGALLRLTEILQRFVEGDPEIEIHSFRGYVTATGANACRAFLRRRHPERTRLANQLRYVLRHDQGLALWAAPDGSTHCGLAAWRDRDASHDLAIDASSRPPQFVPGERGLPSAATLPTLLRRYFLFRGRPARFGELLGSLAEALGVVDRPELSLGESAPDDDHPATDLADSGPGAQRQLEDRESLESLWREVRALPFRQRVALLLNLRDDQGRDRLRLLPLTGVADLHDLALCLEIGLNELQELLPSLPLEDRSLAVRLAVTPRQVINLRKSARARLARRLGRGEPRSGNPGESR